MSNANLPGVELVEQGIADLNRGRETAESLLVSMSAPRLRALGYAVPPALEQPELRLYRLLAEEYGDGAHSRYNALVRRVVSFQRAAACVK
jgi:hypothetical protein